MKPLFYLVVVSLFVVGLGCECKKDSAGEAAPVAGGAPVGGGAAEKPGGGSGGSEDAGVRVKKVVVVELEECCDCTATRQAKSWEALQAAAQKRGSAVEIVKVAKDKSPEEAELYNALKPIMVTPAVYFFDGEEKLVEMLQGELSEEAILKVLEQ